MSNGDQGQLNQLVSWLYQSNEPSIQLKEAEIHRHEEADYVTKLASVYPYRVRIIFEAHLQSQIAAWILARLPQVASVCVLKRDNDLSGIEIASQSVQNNLVDAFKESFANEAAELLLINSELPLLNEKGLLVMDMDSTAIQIECIDELAAMAGVGEEVASVTARAMQGELDFEQSLRLRVGKLAGADAGIIDKLCQSLPLMPGLEASLTELQQHGWKLVVASGGFTPFVNHLMHLLKLDAAFANELVICDGKLTGEVTGDVVDANYKADVIQKCAIKWQVSPSQTVAIGDGANDIPMITTASLGVAFHGKQKLIDAADYAVNRLDLRALVFCLQA